ncbi:MAG TPA: 30S ribosomal protein S4 [Candidatus Coprosoma intestinipullorum]|uniref:Small ribosomal subunit protein uS4 n=1 Tax=Candidatus Coprosoma intestinipullorum TaxID=2840752 RepID=A0A9D1D0I9_9FIRM|nr:30S ribosomal protein S4 [Candidatus Coprosoma intestinipullorum]
MARYTGPVYKKSRHLGFSVLENGKELAKRAYGPGEHGQDRRRKLSNYGVQLQEKQKLKFMYGLSEKQMHKAFEMALKAKGVNGENLLRILESRLDNLVYRIGFATTRKGARQLVNHGHITVNGKKVDIPSYQVKPGDVIGLKDSDKEMAVVKASLEALHNRVEFVTFDEKKMEGTYVRLPERSELNADIDEALVIEYYNRN